MPFGMCFKTKKTGRGQGEGEGGYFIVEVLTGFNELFNEFVGYFTSLFGFDWNFDEDYF